MSRLWVDIETYSSVDLKRFSVYAYSASPDFEILMAAWSDDGETVNLAIGEDEVRDIPGLLDPDVLKIAHNAQFERVCFSRLFGLPEGEFLPTEQWHDTAAVASQKGWPRSLGPLGIALGDQKKDEAGTRLINQFCRPNYRAQDGERMRPDEDPAGWRAFCDYCVQDVHTLISVDRALGWHITPVEEDIYHTDQRINDHGIRIDADLAAAASTLAERNQAAQRLDLVDATGWEVDNPNAVPQIRKWLVSQGVEAPNLTKETVSDLLDGDLTPDQRTVLELRQELALVASKKFATALAGAGTDHRLRGTLKYFGAHTGRWSGKGTQIQNLPRQQLESEDATDAAIAAVIDDGVGDANTLKALVRALFVGPFTVVDYSSIEARVLAWLAGEQWALDAFYAGRDIYVETAERMSTASRPLDRSQGKVAVLALGYNGGVNSLRAMGAEGDNDDLKLLVNQWRRANPRIVRMWQRLGDAFGDPDQVGDYMETYETHDALGRAVSIVLPSGRALTYHGVRWERYKVKDPKTGRLVSKEGWRYVDPAYPKTRIGTYGGKLAENVTQAVARDVMAESLVRLEENGFQPVGHVHDEILVEGEHDVETISEIMTQSPVWAPGLPIDGEGFNCRRYRKG